MGASLHWVFAYGSNMHLADLRGWLERNGHDSDGVRDAVPAHLPEHRLVWNYRSRTRNGGAANVERVRGSELPGVALLVDLPTLGALDRKEGHPCWYDRGLSQRPVRLFAGRAVDAWVYVAVAGRCSVEPVWPRRAYLDLLVEGARVHGLPDAHVAELVATPTLD